MKTAFKHIALFIVLTIICSAFSQSSEYSAKLAYIDRFTKFVTWPKANANLGSIFKVGIIDKNPFGNSLNSLIKNKKIKGKPITSQIITHLKDIKKVDLLIIPKGHKLKIDSILKYSLEHEIMTVGEQKGYANKGLMFNLRLEYGELKFEINKKSVDKQGFQIHSKLYNIANKVIK